MKKVYNAPTLKVVNVKENILAGSLNDGDNTLGNNHVNGGSALSKGSFFDDDDDEEEE